MKTKYIFLIMNHCITGWMKVKLLLLNDTFKSGSVYIALALTLWGKMHNFSEPWFLLL